MAISLPQLSQYSILGSPLVFDGLAPGKLAFFDFVQLFFEPGGKRDVEDVFETLDQQRAHALTEHGGGKTPLVFCHVFALEERGNDGGVRRGPPNAVFFELFHQRGIVEPRRRFGKMLVWANLVQAESLPFRNLRKRAAFTFVIFLFVIAVGDRRGQLVNAQVAVEFLYRAGSAKRVISGGNVDSRLIENRREHLRCHKPLPDRLVEFEKVFVEVLANVFRRAHGVRGTHRFVGLLRVLLRFVVIGFLRQIVRTKALGDQFANLNERVVRNMHGIGAHVSDQRHRALIAQFHAFVELLRQRHRALGGVAQPVVGGLLQFGSRERRGGITLLFLLRDRRNLPLRLADCGDDPIGALLVLYFNILALVFE